MDIPRGEILLESPLDFVNLTGVLQKFKDKGYLELLLTGESIEEGYVFIESGIIIGIFYEGPREGEHLHNVQELIDENPVVILHKLTDTQIDVLKEVYPLNKRYKIGEFLGDEAIVVETVPEEISTPKGVEPTKPVAKSAKTEAKKSVAVPGKWGEKVPIFVTKGAGTSQVTLKKMGKEEFMENVDLFVREIIKYVDGKRTIRDIIEESGQKPEDVIGVIEPYRKTGYLKFKE